MAKLLAVALGGLLGASARYLISGWAQKWLGASFPWGTAIVNIIGCFWIGYLMTYGIEISPMSVEARLFLVTGVLGGLTTFSAFGYETMRFVQDGALHLALGNISLNLIAGLSAVVLGTWLARAL